MANIVAVTGGIGSGKSEACKLFRQLGVPVVDLDEIAHAMSAPGSSAMQRVRQAFGDQYFDDHGNLLRSRLRELVFAEPDALDRLNDIMHPAIREAALDQVAEYAAAPYVVLAIPLLVESKADWSMIAHVLVIDCEEQTQIERVVRRSQLSEQMAQAMMAVQSSRKQRLAIADSVIENNGSLENLAQKIGEFHEKYSNTC